jgi:hypothetical protein
MKIAGFDSALSESQNRYSSGLVYHPSNGVLVMKLRISVECCFVGSHYFHWSHPLTQAYFMQIKTVEEVLYITMILRMRLKGHLVHLHMGVEGMSISRK